MIGPGPVTKEGVMLLLEISPESQAAASRLLSDSQWGAILLISWSALFSAIVGLFTYIVMLSRQQRNDLKEINETSRVEADTELRRIIEITDSSKETNEKAVDTLKDTAEVVRNLQRSVDDVRNESRECCEVVRTLNIRLDNRPCLLDGGGGR